MNRLTRFARGAAAALLCVFCVALAQAQTTQPTATNLKMSSFKVPSGVVTFTPVDIHGSPIPFADATGSQNGPTAYECAIIAGAIAGAWQGGTAFSGTCSIPDAAQTVPANILYQITVADTSMGGPTSGKSYTLQAVSGITGATWALDHYGPGAQTTSLQPIQFLQGPTTPGSCLAPYFFSNTTTLTSYACIAGVYVALANGSAQTEILIASAFPGSDASIKINNCISAAIMAGGTTCDAGMLGGTQVMSEQINVGSSSSGNSSIGVTLLLPTTATWKWGLTDGVSCGIKQYSSTSIVGLGPGGGGNRMVLDTLSGTNMDSLYCTDPTNVDGGSYVRASGFNAYNTGAGTLVNGLMDVRHLFDESQLFNMMAENDYGDSWHIAGACCGSSFDHIQGSSNSAGGGVGLVIGKGYVLLNASTTNGSSIVTTPNASLTNAYVGFTIAGSGIPAMATITSVTSRNSLTISANATATTSANALQIYPDGQNDGVGSITISNSTFNRPGVGLPDIMIVGNLYTSSVNLDNIYMEGNNATDTTTPFIYLGPEVNGVHLNSVDCNGDIPGSKYCLENHTAFPFAVTAMHTSSGIKDVANNALVPPYGSGVYSGIDLYGPGMTLPTLNIQAGITAAQNAGIFFRDYTSTQRFWLFLDQYGNNFRLLNSQTGVDRLYIAPGAETYLTSEGATQVRLNYQGGAGLASTAGTCFGSGGASPYCAGSIDGAGNLSTASLISWGTQSISGCTMTAATGGKSAGQFASGITGTCTVTVTLPTAPHGWECSAHDITTPGDLFTQSTPSTIGCTFAGTTVSGDVIVWSARGY